MKKFTILITAILITLLLGCQSSNQRLARKMLAKYSDNQNYITLSGEIVEYNDNNRIVIKCKDLQSYLSYQNELCTYQIFSSQPLDLQVGSKIQFVTVPFHFYNGHRLPIVELSIDGNSLLNFDEGKANLIDWVNATFK